MATVGQILSTPETGWTPFMFMDNLGKFTCVEYSLQKYGIDNFKHLQSGTIQIIESWNLNGNGQYLFSQIARMRFSVSNTDAIRLTGYCHTVPCSTISTVTVDGVDYPISFNYQTGGYTLIFELTGLDVSKKHNVQINFNDSLRSEVSRLHLKTGGTMGLYDPYLNSSKSFSYIL